MGVNRRIRHSSAAKNRAEQGIVCFPIAIEAFPMQQKDRDLCRRRAHDAMTPCCLRHLARAAELTGWHRRGIVCMGNYTKGTIGLYTFCMVNMSVFPSSA